MSFYLFYCNIVCINIKCDVGLQIVFLVLQYIGSQIIIYHSRHFEKTVGKKVVTVTFILARKSHEADLHHPIFKHF